MKNNSLILLVSLIGMIYASNLYGQSRPQATGDLYIRDPFIVTDAQKGIYYMYGSSSQKGREGQTIGGVAVYKSRDLKTWEGPQQVFTVPEDNWITGMVWAPEVHVYNGRYYLFATLNSDIEWKKRREGWSAYTFRGTQIFHADAPEGPFLPFGRTPHTPMDYMALDGTLWVEDGTPWMVFCHEWVQMTDGTMDAVELKPDLSAPVGRPFSLFCASSAPWAPEGNKYYVTDGCFVYRTKAGKLLMIWSSFSQEGYAIGIAESTTGKITGPWKQHPEPLFNQNGGHGMIFHTFDGKLCIAFHQPNSGGAERAHIYELEDTGHTLLLKQELK
ncbi:MAG: glycoside hydrolase family 43 protein [Dysgonamonadaceae bacterium]|jgi:beta-xylosidase|nr:glycoside hydrolase family 43 protein [Dysgonamonadaceae bacterium]